MATNIHAIIAASIAVKQEILADNAFQQKVQDITDAVIHAFQSGKKVMFCGNGGSAADAQHLAAEFSGRFYKNRRALPSDALHCNTSYLTAVANDYSYDDIYSRLVDGTMEKGDVLIGISTSGNSPNIVKAFETARAKGIVTVGFTGASGGKMKDLSDYLLNVPSTVTPRIQESHILLGHIICELTEAAIFND
ncbi:MAG: D-sedoheptulose 7-phosphate isomerase [Sediminibacterium sp. Gen4]|jgi:D-sedoheptulose 7-phosphate isomerase|uniref:D-sedoheptulose-7-phosphate isomerase n=1 Tax=unclassified Sediminibacterium TaxID=2635961 RepID=UPI0015BD3894|nr:MULTISPECIES: D-sedoheptulose 7-phosphate isomerase [unclassified Sediminibacterium]MBW0160202.1 D-sedoheptulose 7-phosphate isomerase [Sediminibacterium sp.]MBW0163764.1 D-sedoheptulose 7-phosphate isomerase [Sediminibacterium sp.]NWK67063.1 D-sedoheptulose 7-phosphate isomerase [Sediminibacterium sp. Gen4]